MAIVISLGTKPAKTLSLAMACFESVELVDVNYMNYMSYDIF